MGSPKSDEKRGANELLSHKVKVSDFWMGKYEVTWDEYELWMINLDKDNREYNKATPTKADSLADAVTKPTAPYTDMTFGMGKSGHRCYLHDSTFSQNVLHVVKCEDR